MNWCIYNDYIIDIFHNSYWRLFISRSWQDKNLLSSLIIFGVDTTRLKGCFQLFVCVNREHLDINNIIQNLFNDDIHIYLFGGFKILASQMCLQIFYFTSRFMSSSRLENCTFICSVDYVQSIWRTILTLPWRQMRWTWILLQFDIVILFLFLLLFTSDPSEINN